MLPEDSEQADTLYIVTHAQQSSQTAEYQPQIRTALVLEMCDLHRGKPTLSRCTFPLLFWHQCYRDHFFKPPVKYKSCMKTLSTKSPGEMHRFTALWIYLQMQYDTPTSDILSQNCQETAISVNITGTKLQEQKSIYLVAHNNLDPDGNRVLLLPQASSFPWFCRSLRLIKELHMYSSRSSRKLL